MASFGFAPAAPPTLRIPDLDAVLQVGSQEGRGAAFPWHPLTSLNSRGKLSVGWSSAALRYRSVGAAPSSWGDSQDLLRDVHLGGQAEVQGATGLFREAHGHGLVAGNFL